MFSPNAYARIFEDMDILKFAMNFRKLGSVDVRIIEYLNALPTETVAGVDGTKVYRGSYSDLTRDIGYDDPCNLRKAILRLKDLGVVIVKQDGRKIEAVVLNKYWMLRVMKGVC